jgi:hypothetical protein
VSDVPAEETPFRVADQEYDPAIPVDSIKEHPANYNFGDIGAISESMDEHGFYGAVLVQRSTGFILAGNHRHRTAVMKGAATIPGFWLDCDDDTAARILAVDNRTTHLATFDDEALVRLLAAVATTPRGLKGTGYDGDDLQDLVQQLSPPELDKLGGGGGPKDDDMWPVLRFKVPPDIRDEFYRLTDQAEDQTNEGRFHWLLSQVGLQPA